MRATTHRAEHSNAFVRTSGGLFARRLILTAIVVAVCLGSATGHRVLGPTAGMASGGAVALCGLFARPISGASMNPARSLAPAIVWASSTDLWACASAPFPGATLATAVMHGVHHRKHDEELEAAAGEPKGPR